MFHPIFAVALEHTRMLNTSPGAFVVVCGEDAATPVPQKPLMTSSREETMPKSDTASHPDLRIKRLSQKSWQVTAASPHARTWFRQQIFFGEIAEKSRINTNIHELNRLTFLAIDKGLVVELCGPNRSIRI